MIFDSYIKRKRALDRGPEPDIYEYDVIPNFLRKQVTLAIEAGLGPWWAGASYDLVEPRNGNAWWRLLAETMEREIQSFPDRKLNDQHRCLQFLSIGGEIDEWLTIVEFACYLLSSMAADGRAAVSMHECGAGQRADSVIEEINERFREHAFGYEYRNGKIIRIDNQFVHREVVKPALALLAEPGFEKANEEFMLAHQHYREGQEREAIVAANRAFESTLKAICRLRGWEFQKGDVASQLVTVVRRHGLFPQYLDNGMNTYVAMLKTGLPDVRNNAGGHGAAPEAPAVPNYLAAYALHLTASNILLAIEANRPKK